MAKRLFSVLLTLVLLFICVVPEAFAEGAKLNTGKVTFYKGNTFKLSVLNSSEDVTFKSSNPKVARVDNNGTITAVKKGSAKITATVGGKKLSCSVTVKQLVEGLKLNTSQSTITKKGKTVKLKATVSPKNADNKKLVWTSSNNSVATVNKSGTVKAVNEGTCVITAKAQDGTGFTASCQITVKYVKATSLKLNKTNIQITKVGKTQTLKATIKPNNAEIKKVVWTSSNPSVATVSSKGVVKAKAEGECVIKATTQDGTNIQASCYVKVSPIKVKTIKLSKTAATLKGEGKSTTLKAKIAPSNAANKIVKWESSNPYVATVSSKGVVKAKANGVCYITAKTQDGTNKAASCKITVTGCKTIAPTPTPQPALIVTPAPTAKPAATPAPTAIVSKPTSSETQITIEYGAVYKKQVINKGENYRAVVKGDAKAIWSSSDTSVATVSAAGVITPVSNGICVIQGKSSDNSTSALLIVETDKCSTSVQMPTVAQVNDLNKLAGNKIAEVQMNTDLFKQMFDQKYMHITIKDASGNDVPAIRTWFVLKDSLYSQGWRYLCPYSLSYENAFTTSRQWVIDGKGLVENSKNTLSANIMTGFKPTQVGYNLGSATGIITLMNINEMFDARPTGSDYLLTSRHGRQTVLLGEFAYDFDYVNRFAP